jgi:hypothetical protein
MIIEEQSIEMPDGILEPNFVVMHQNRVHVVDVTICHEDIGYLQYGYNNRVKKYTPLLQILTDQHHLDPGIVLPILVGTRGAIPKSTLSSLEEMGI